MAGISKHGHTASVAAQVEVPVEAQVDSVAVESAKPTGVKRIKAIPFPMAPLLSFVRLIFLLWCRASDVKWDYRIDDFTVAVGDGITAEAANVLVSKFPDSFKFV